MQNSENITQFISQDIISALQTFLKGTSEKELNDAACVMACAFGDCGSFKQLASEESEDRDQKESKLISSFHSNLNLLVQKTWVEKSDETVKEQALFRITEFGEACENKAYAKNYENFLSILRDVVYLMFGAQSKKDDFLAYALRIDPGFGIFWWYISNLPPKTEWSDEKCRLAILLGMYFLANY